MELVTMGDEQAIQETITWCVAIMVAYHNVGPNKRSKQEMVAELRAVGEASKAFSLSAQEIVARIVQPVESEIFARYGHELGSRLNSQFLAAFEGHGVTERQTIGVGSVSY
jgi:hypothetical protein